MTPDPRTEEIRARLAGYPESIGVVVDNIDFSGTQPIVTVRLHYRDSDAIPAAANPYAHFLAHASSDMAHLLGRIEALNASNQAIARTAVQHRESAHRRAERLGAALKENRDLRKALRDPNEIARQCADLRDELDAARRETDEARTRAAEYDNELTRVQIENEDLTAGRDRLRAVADAAREVMRLLAEHGPSIVPHLMDDDENSGQRLRAALDALDGES